MIYYFWLRSFGPYTFLSRRPPTLVFDKKTWGKTRGQAEAICCASGLKSPRRLVPQVRLSGVKINQMRRGGKSKNLFFNNFFISFHISTYKFIASEKSAFFAAFAHVRPTKGNACPVGCVVCYPIGVFFREIRDARYYIRDTLHEIRDTNNELRSINIERLCETNPISEMSKWL